MSTPNSDPLVAAPVTEDPAAPAAPAAAEPALTVVPEAAPPGITLTSEQLTERMERHAQAQMEKMFGTRDPGQLKQMLADGKAAAEKVEEARQAQLSENEKLKEEVASFKAQAQEAQEAAELTTYEKMVAAECSALGIKDMGYALYRLEQHAGTLGDADEMDLAEFLKDDLEKNRGGYRVDAPVEVVDAPATTGHTQAAPTPSNGQTPAFDAMTATDAELKAHKASMGL